ncbi:methyl-accepting chemotaxis protein [Pseudomonas sp. RIT412]|nr:methyl-accepting chemotaxis protein [Pseudomonas sp. RIT 409]RAU55343.1 methyl-accepting chemotaxis protein [Pseudomonas sp. RIT 412]
MGEAMHDMAAGHGDLTQRLNIQSQDEFGYLGEGFNLFVKRIHISMQEVASATTALNDVAMLVVSASNSSMINCDQQADRSTSVATSTNQLGATANDIAQSAARTASYSNKARELSFESLAVVEQNLDSMHLLSARISSASQKIESLNSKTENIGQILEVITDISRQTNLLALNAAIEAARAGDAGRGFAVVADEVRNLSLRTQDSASQVQQIIEALQAEAQEAVEIMIQGQSKSEDSVKIAVQTASALKNVATHIGEIDAMNQSVAAATEEQSSVVHSINAEISQTSILNQQGLHNLQTTLQACTDLEHQAVKLKQLVANFQI